MLACPFVEEIFDWTIFGCETRFGFGFDEEWTALRLLKGGYILSIRISHLIFDMKLWFSFCFWLIGTCNKIQPWLSAISYGINEDHHRFLLEILGNWCLDSMRLLRRTKLSVLDKICLLEAILMGNTSICHLQENRLLQWMPRVELNCNFRGWTFGRNMNGKYLYLSRLEKMDRGHECQEWTSHRIPYSYLSILLWKTLINMAGCLLSNVITMRISLNILEFVDIHDSVDLFFINTGVLAICDLYCLFRSRIFVSFFHYNCVRFF